MPAKTRTPRAKPPAARPAAKKAAPKRPAKGDATAEPGELIAAVRALERVAEGLRFTHESFTESLLRLPRAEDYEPLTEPMRRLAATIPALLEALDERRAATASASTPPAASKASGGAVPTVAVPAVASAVAALAVGEATAAPSPAASGEARVSSATAAAREAVASARARLSQALDCLPRSEDYTPVARNLRALASVSPSLMAWLAEVPTLTAPLTDAVAGLREAAAELELALDLLGKDRETEAPRVKVVVRGAPA
jgi:hypothetical protein